MRISDLSSDVCSSDLGVHRACGPGAQRPDPAIRLRVPDGTVVGFDDRVHGTVEQDVPAQVGDFVLRRADGPWAYQLAVVVDDAAQGITEVVRGADLLDSTARQVFLQHRLGLPTPYYAHLPLVVDADRSEEHTSELQSLMRISYDVFFLKKTNQNKQT